MADRERTGMITFDFCIRALFHTPPVLVYKPEAKNSFQKKIRSCIPCVKARDDSDSGDDKDWI